MKTLLLLRHAKAERESSTGQDKDRPLSERGRQDAPLMGRAMRKLRLTPDLVLCSSSVRTRETSELALKKAKYKGEIDYLDELYLAEGHTILSLIQRQSMGSMILEIGHNPGMEDLIGMLTTGKLGGVRFPTSGFAKITFDVETWADVREGIGSLEFLLVPSVVDNL